MKFGPKVSTKPRMPTFKLKIRPKRLVRRIKLEGAPSIGKGMMKGERIKSPVSKVKKIKL